MKDDSSQLSWSRILVSQKFSWDEGRQFPTLFYDHREAARSLVGMKDDSSQRTGYSLPRRVKFSWDEGRQFPTMQSVSVSRPEV